MLPAQIFDDKELIKTIPQSNVKNNGIGIITKPVISSGSLKSFHSYQYSDSIL